ncbi:MAG TPA: hypothetical protein VEH47_08540 [Candidatus Acidoferrales bacterium]|nr:hypothetical protein [Candidatus Acidoferrales bacterium]
MKQLFFAGLLLLFLAPLPAMAQSPFDGTWKADPSTFQYPEKPDQYLLQNGMYECKTCAAPINIRADGADQKITDPYADTMAVKVIDDHNVENTTKKNGKVVGTAKSSVSGDGETLSVNWTYSGNPTGGTQSGSYTAKRVAQGPAGANLISGSWRTQKEEDSAAVLTWTFKVSGNELTMTNPTGQSYTAKLDGTEAPYKGDPGITSVSVRMLDKDTLEETDKRDGKVIGIAKNTITADGKTLKFVYEDKLHGTTIKGDAQKQ